MVQIRTKGPFIYVRFVLFSRTTFPSRYLGVAKLRKPVGIFYYICRIREAFTVRTRYLKELIPSMFAFCGTHIPTLKSCVTLCTYPIILLIIIFTKMEILRLTTLHILLTVMNLKWNLFMKRRNRKLALQQRRLVLKLTSTVLETYISNFS